MRNSEPIRVGKKEQCGWLAQHLIFRAEKMVTTELRLKWASMKRKYWLFISLDWTCVQIKCICEISMYVIDMHNGVKIVIVFAYVH